MIGVDVTNALANVLKEGLAVGVVVVDRDCRVVSWNSWMEKHSNIREKDIVGKSILDEFPDIERRGKANFLLQCIRTTKPALLSPLIHQFFVPLELVRAGRTVTMLQHTRIYPLVEKDECCGAIIIIEDMTESILNEKEIVRLNRVLAAIRNINQLITRVNDEIPMLNEACAILVQQAGYDAVIIGVVQGTKMNLVAIDGKGLSPDLIQNVYTLWATADCFTGPTVEVLETGMMKVMDPIEPQALCSVLRELSSELRCVALCGLPLKYDTEVLGVMTILSRKPGLFVGDELSLLYEVASDLGYAMRALRDRVARRKAEEQVKESLAFNQAVLEGSPIGIMTFTSEGGCLSANERAAAILGVTRENLCSSNIRDHFPQTPDELDADFREVLTYGKTKQREMMLTLRDGRTRWLAMLFTLLEAGGKPNILALIEDITERKQSVTALIQSERLKAIGELSAGVSHNFNNLLQVIMSAAQMSQIDMELNKLSAVDDNLQRIVNACKQGAETVRRLQRFTAPQTDVSEQNKVVDISDIVAEAVEMTKVWWKTLPEKKGVKIDFNTHLVTDCYVVGVESELFEVAVNLIKNAVEAVPDGGAVTIRTFSDGNEVVLQVIDNGKGISKENAERIFEPFFTTKGVQRSGLGLSSSYGIIQNHQGEILVSSNEGFGTQVMVKLPAAYPLAPVQPDVAPAVAAKKKLNIIAVDDLAPVVEVIQKGLEMWGHNVVTALSGEEALQIFDVNKTDLIVTDLAMPGMTGWELGKKVTELCHHAGVKKTPIIMLTGWEDEAKDHKKLQDSGVDAVLTKPLRIDELVNTINKVVDDSEATLH